jgi:hypothetical protein
MKFGSVILALLMVVTTADVEAKRLGGGTSLGRQSSNVSKREAALLRRPLLLPPPIKPLAPHLRVLLQIPPRRPPSRRRLRQRRLLRLRAVLGPACWPVWRRVWVWPGWPAA